MNIVLLVGHLGEDAEVIETKAGTTMVKMLLATKSYSNKDNKPDWHTIIVKGQLAKTCVRCSKGMKLAISGHLRTQSWVDKDGKTNHRQEVVAEKVEFHSTPKRKEFAPNQDD